MTPREFKIRARDLLMEVLAATKAQPPPVDQVETAIFGIRRLINRTSRIRPHAPFLGAFRKLDDSLHGPLEAGKPLAVSQVEELALHCLAALDKAPRRRRRPHRD